MGKNNILLHRVSEQCIIIFQQTFSNTLHYDQPNRLLEEAYELWTKNMNRAVISFPAYNPPLVAVFNFHMVDFSLPQAKPCLLSLAF